VLRRDIVLNYTGNWWHVVRLKCRQFSPVQIHNRYQVANVTNSSRSAFCNPDPSSPVTLLEISHEKYIVQLMCKGLRCTVHVTQVVTVIII
jgi:hypothetical protein